MGLWMRQSPLRCATLHFDTNIMGFGAKTSVMGVLTAHAEVRKHGLTCTLRAASVRSFHSSSALPLVGVPKHLKQCEPAAHLEQNTTIQALKFADIYSSAAVQSGQNAISFAFEVPRFTNIGGK